MKRCIATIVVLFAVLPLAGCGPTYKERMAQRHAAARVLAKQVTITKVTFVDGVGLEGTPL